jgi:hypothetical protein
LYKVSAKIDDKWFMALVFARSGSQAMTKVNEETGIHRTLLGCVEQKMSEGQIIATGYYEE